MSTLSPIVISEDGTICLKEEDGIERRTDLSKILSPPCMEVAPRGCRFVSKKLGTHIFLIEQEPRTRTIRLNFPLLEEQWTVLTESGRADKYGLTKRADRNRREFTLVFPYTVFLVCLQGIHIVSLKVFFRDQPIQAMSDHLLTAAFTKDDVFFPVMDGEIPLYDQIPASIAERAIEWFWQQEFSPDLGSLYRATIAQMETVWDWEHHSLGDYLWILRARFAPSTTIKESVSRFLAGTDEVLSSHELVYRVFRGYLQNVVLEGDQGKKEDLVIPTFSIRAGSSIIRLGDAIHCSAMIEGSKLQSGMDYVVLGFFKPQREGQILVRLEGVRELVVIGNRSEGLRRGLELIKSVSSFLREVASIDGSPIVQGAKFTVANRDDLLLTVGESHEIFRVFIDKDGDVLVSIPGTSGNFYLTYNGGTLLPSVRLMIPRLEGNTFQYGDKELSVGQVVKITDSSFPSVPKNMVVRVASVGENNLGQYVATFEGVDGTFTVFEQRKLTLDWKPYAFEHTKDKVIFGEHTLDLASGRFLLFIKAKDGFVVGKSYRIADIIQSKDLTRHPLDLDIILEQSSTPVPLIRQSQWVLSKETVAVFSEPLSFPTNLECAGTVVGKDENGKNIMIGSMVRCLRESYSDTRWDSRTKEIPGIVVHHYPGHPFLYVFYPFDLAGRDGYTPGRTLGDSGIPKDYRQPRRMQIVKPKDCQVV